MDDLESSTIFLSILFTWLIGLAPPLFIRYVWLKRPVAIWPGVGICFGFWIFNLLFFIVMGSKSKTHGALVLVSIASFYILTKIHAQSNVNPTGHNASPTIGEPVNSVTEVPRFIPNSGLGQEWLNPMRAPSLKSSGVARKSIGGQSINSKGSVGEGVDDDCWAQALVEFEAGDRHLGLWARMYSEAHGNESIAKANYLAIRSGEMARNKRISSGIDDDALKSPQRKAVSMPMPIAEQRAPREVRKSGQVDQICPACHLISPHFALRCDCGFNFSGSASPSLSKVQNCPICNLINPPSAERCDCGYLFG